MLKITYTILIIMCPLLNYCQSKNIPLQDLGSFTLRNFDEIETYLKQYNYDFKGSSSGYFRGVKCNNYSFERRNETIMNLKEGIILSKYAIDTTDKTYKVSYSCLAEDVFNAYKAEVLESRTKSFLKEITDGNIYHRIYRYNLFEYDFVVKKTEIDGMPLHVLIITF